MGVRSLPVPPVAGVVTPTVAIDVSAAHAPVTSSWLASGRPQFGQNRLPSGAVASQAAQRTA